MDTWSWLLWYSAAFVLPRGIYVVSRVVKVSAVANHESRSITHGVSAFSGASLLVILQGSFGALSGPLLYAAVFFAVAVPLCVSASMLSFIFGQREEIPELANRFFDWIQILGWVSGVVGFLQLIISFSGLLGAVFAVSAVVSFALFWFVASLVLRYEKKVRRSSKSEAARLQERAETPRLTE